jgi:hypothetical protein
VNAAEVSGSHSVVVALHSYSECQVLILRVVQVQNVIEDVQIVQKQRTLVTVCASDVKLYDSCEVSSDVPYS